MNGTWDTGDTHAFRTVFEGASDWHLTGSLYEHARGLWVWSVFAKTDRYATASGLTAEVRSAARYPAEPLDRMRPSEEEARDACVAWVQRAVMLGVLRSR